MSFLRTRLRLTSRAGALEEAETQHKEITITIKKIMAAILLEEITRSLTQLAQETTNTYIVIKMFIMKIQNINKIHTTTTATITSKPTADLINKTTKCIIGNRLTITTTISMTITTTHST